MHIMINKSKNVLGVWDNIYNNTYIFCYQPQSNPFIFQLNEKMHTYQSSFEPGGVA